MEIQEIENSTKSLIDSLKSACGALGLGNSGDEYRIIVQMFLYKYFNDKFGYEAKKLSNKYGKRLANAEKWDAEYDKFSEDEVEDLFSYLPEATPLLYPRHTLGHLFNAQQQGGFADLLDATLVEISNLNADVFSMITDDQSRVEVFQRFTDVVRDRGKRDEFAISLVQELSNPKNNFEPIFSLKYDFFSTMFEYLISDYNKDGGGKYAEYYTPKAVATIMARMLVKDDEKLRGVSCYDPASGTGTLLMALAHQIGEKRCSIYSQDISQKSTDMLRLNLILNNLVGSIPNVVQGNTLMNPAHKDSDGTLKKFNFIVSNPPFNLDFPGFRDTIAADKKRFWAGVPNIPKTIDPKKPKMKIYLCFIQHMLNSLKDDGRGAIVVPTGFITSSQTIEQNILSKVVDEHVIYGCVSMPSNVFATTGTNVSIIFFDKRRKHDKVVLIDASKLGEDYKDGNNQRHRLRDFEVDQIVNTFREQKAIDDFSVVVDFDEIKAKKYSLSAGQYFDVKIEHIDITAKEFKARVEDYKTKLSEQFKMANKLDKEILSNLDDLEFGK